jgi:lipid-binding SYLF domain-containing protein
VVSIFNSGLAIITMVKGGLLWLIIVNRRSGRGGSGLVISRLKESEHGGQRWSAPLLINCGGIGFGAIIGLQTTDTILVIYEIIRDS